MNTKIEKLELVVPSIDNPFGSLELHMLMPIVLEPNKKYPEPKEEVDIKLSEKTVALISELKESIIKDLC